MSALAIVPLPQLTDEQVRVRKQALGYLGQAERPCCATCDYVRLGEASDANGSQLYVCSVGQFVVRRGGLCHAWRLPS